VLACIIGCHNTKTLTELGAQVVKFDLNTTDMFGQTALSYCARESAMQSTLEWLVELGATVNLQDRVFETPLFHACRAQNIKAAVFLLQTGGADSSLTNEEQRQAGDYLEDPAYRALFNDTKVKYISKVKYPEEGYRKKPEWIKDTFEIL
jgi:ankyrin repeat protein